LRLVVEEFSVPDIRLLPVFARFCPLVTIVPAADAASVSQSGHSRHRRQDRGIEQSDDPVAGNSAHASVAAITASISSSSFRQACSISGDHSEPRISRRVAAITPKNLPNSSRGVP